VIRSFRSSAAGFTFVELVVATAVMMILASAALPLARVSIRRQKETELRRDLREMRTAIDKFKDNADLGRIAASELQFGSENYPPTLQVLVDGVAMANDATGRKMKFLRRIPIDPITGSADWGLRAFQDQPDAKTWGGQSVFDVYSKAEGVALDGTKYRNW
jgi:general secretion pathway protein G